MKEGGKRQNPLRLRQSARENSLQDNRGYESDKRKRLPNAHEQLGAVVVRGSPRAGDVCIQVAGKSHERKTGSQKQARVKVSQQNECGDKRDQQQRNCAPDHRRPDLIGFKPVDCQRLWDQDDRCYQTKAKQKQSNPK